MDFTGNRRHDKMGHSECLPSNVQALEPGIQVPWGNRHVKVVVIINVIFSWFPSFPCLAGVNSFMVSMAYKDLYQVSTTEVATHVAALFGLSALMGFHLLLLTWVLGTWVTVVTLEDHYVRLPLKPLQSLLHFKGVNGLAALGETEWSLSFSWQQLS